MPIHRCTFQALLAYLRNGLGCIIPENAVIVHGPNAEIAGANDVILADNSESDVATLFLVIPENSSAVASRPLLEERPHALNRCPMPHLRPYGHGACSMCIRARARDVAEQNWFAKNVTMPYDGLRRRDDYAV